MYQPRVRNDSANNINVAGNNGNLVNAGNSSLTSRAVKHGSAAVARVYDLKHNAYDFTMRRMNALSGIRNTRYVEGKFDNDIAELKKNIQNFKAKYEKFKTLSGKKERAIEKDFRKLSEKKGEILKNIVDDIKGLLKRWDSRIAVMPDLASSNNTASSKVKKPEIIGKLISAIDSIEREFSEVRDTLLEKTGFERKVNALKPDDSEREISREILEAEEKTLQKVMNVWGVLSKDLENDINEFNNIKISEVNKLSEKLNNKLQDLDRKRSDANLGYKKRRVKLAISMFEADRIKKMETKAKATVKVEDWLRKNDEINNNRT